MDATLKRSKLASLVAAVASLALIPVVWAFAFQAIPALQVVRTEQAGGRLGPWAFSWVLVWIATLSCVGVAWLCYSSVDDATT